MTNKSKTAMLVTLATIGITAPAFAQSFDPDNGTGNVLSFANQATESYAHAIPEISTRHETVAKHRVGFDAFAMAPQGSDDPTLTGGGSLGYNENLRNY